jgi:cysteine desulfuration protein SufE
VRGCQSQVWLHASLDDDKRVVLQADSDAMIVRGLIAVVLRIYSGANPAEILSNPPDFIRDIGLDGHLSPTRTNGLRSLVEQLMYYAKAFQTILAVQN